MMAAATIAVELDSFKRMSSEEKRAWTVEELAKENNADPALLSRPSRSYSHLVSLTSNARTLAPPSERLACARRSWR